jgi:flagellar motor switch protein FliN/FliY
MTDAPAPSGGAGDPPAPAESPAASATPESPPAAESSAAPGDAAPASATTAAAAADAAIGDAIATAAADASNLASEVSAAISQPSAAAAAGAAAAPEAGAIPTGGDPAVDELLRQAKFDDPISGTAIPPEIAAMATAAASAASGTMPDAQPFSMPNLAQAMHEAQTSSIDLLRDVELNVKIELGRSRMLVEDVLKLGEGSVVELDKLAGDPVDVFVNDRLVARGEVLVLNDNFCVRVNEIVAAIKDDVV